MITFFHDAPLASGGQIELPADAAQHARARRVRVGDLTRVLNGRGQVAEGRVADVSRDAVAVAVTRVTEVTAPTPVEVIVPVADRDRMLIAAEKCTELQVTGWRPAYYARSRSVSPRGEGEKFRAKLTARMQAALEQSGGAWLPMVYPERELLDAIGGVPPGWTRILLDSSGTSLPQHISNIPIALAVGPEGGIEAPELESVRSHGWTIASLGATTLRFETAIIAAVSVVRALQHPVRTSQRG